MAQRSSEAKEEVIRLGSQKVLDIVFLDDIKKQLVMLNTAIARLPQSAEGIADTSRVAILATDNDKRVPFTMPMFSVTMINDGPTSVFMAINKSAYGDAPLQIGETVTVDAHAPKISTVRFRCATVGGVATVRLFTVR